ncbi:dynein intermediate chain 3, ciliary-like [Halyomorpha halys]|uniref:dynein intermediate chain 3, ciliary-like n=1 Tax=Halyomorpha halys TaxID=286706 RepID=UPI0034D27632
MRVIRENGERLEQVENFKYLGVNLNESGYIVEEVSQKTDAAGRVFSLFQRGFLDCEDSDMIEQEAFRTVNVFRDPLPIKRPVSNISWSPDQGSRLAVSYSNLDFQKENSDAHINSYIWHVENPNRPELVIDAGVPIVCLEYNPRDVNTLIGGLYNGQVAYWDVRRGGHPLKFSDHYESFRDPVTCVLWVNSKSGSEFFSASTDGQYECDHYYLLPTTVWQIVISISK